MKNNDLSGTIQHNQYILNSLKDLERILEPNHTSPNVLTYKAKREDCNLPIQTRIYFHNKMNSLWDSASNLLNSLTAEDELHYGLSKEELRHTLNEKYNEYEMKTYIYELKRSARLDPNYNKYNPYVRNDKEIS